MHCWLPAGDTLLQMITIHLPSPVTVQKYHCEVLYEGPPGDEAAIGIKSQIPKALSWCTLPNGANLWQRSVLCLWPGLLRGSVYTGLMVCIMGPNSGREGGPVPEANPEDNPDDGLLCGAHRGVLWQHHGPGGRGPVPGEDRHHHHLWA